MSVRVTKWSPPRRRRAGDGRGAHPRFCASIVWVVSGPPSVLAASRAALSVSGSASRSVSTSGGRWESNQIVWLAGDVSRIGSPGQKSGGRRSGGRRSVKNLFACHLGRRPSNARRAHSLAGRGGLIRGRRRGRLDGGSRSSGGTAATRSAPRSPPPRPFGRGGKGNAGPPAQGCASRAPLADRVGGTDRLAWASTPCALRRGCAGDGRVICFDLHPSACQHFPHGNRRLTGLRFFGGHGRANRSPTQGSAVAFGHHPGLQ